MLYFFHHYELPLILHQAQLQHLLLRTQAVPTASVNQPEEAATSAAQTSSTSTTSSTMTTVTSTITNHVISNYRTTDYSYISISPQTSVTTQANQASTSQPTSNTVTETQQNTSTISSDQQTLITQALSILQTLPNTSFSSSHSRVQTGQNQNIQASSSTGSSESEIVTLSDETEPEICNPKQSSDNLSNGVKHEEEASNQTVEMSENLSKENCDDDQSKLKNSGSSSNQ